MSEPKRELPLTPKARFLLSNDNISKHRIMVDSNEFQRACDFAMLQYQTQLMGAVTDGNGAAQVGIKLRGAHEFMQIFRLLSDREVVFTAPKIVDHLPEPAKQ